MAILGVFEKALTTIKLLTRFKIWQLFTTQSPYLFRLNTSKPFIIINNILFV